MSHILEFLDLVDTPSTYASQANRILVVNTGETALEFVTGVNASSIDGKPISAASPADGDVLVYDGTTDNRWENVTPLWLAKTGGTMTAGDLTLYQNPTSNMHAANKKWIEDNFSAGSHAHDSTYLKLDASNDPMTGTLDWTNAAGPSIMNEAATTTNPTLIPNKADLTTGIGWASATVVLVSSGADTLEVKGGTITAVASDILFANNKALQSKESGGTARDLATINASNVVLLGSSSLATLINGTSVTSNTDIRVNGANAYQLNLGGSSDVYYDALSVDSTGSDFVVLGNTSFETKIHSSGGVILANARPLQGTALVTGTFYDLIQLNSSNEVAVGNSSQALNLLATQIDSIAPLANTVYLRGEETGGTARDLIGMDGSNYLVLGNTTTTVIELKAASYVRLNNMGSVRIGDISGGQYVTIEGTTGNVLLTGDAYVATANYASATKGVRSSVFESSKKQTLSNDSALNPFTWAATTVGDHLFATIFYSFYCTYTVSAVTKYFQQSGVYYWMGFHDGTNINLTDMSGSIPTPVTVNTGTGTVAVTINAGADGTPPKGPNWKIAVSGTGTFVSANVQYCIISTDSSHRGFNTIY